MSLTSLEYFVFLSFVAIQYYVLSHKWRVYLLLAASFAFYYLNQHWYAAILLSSILLNYTLCSLWLNTRANIVIYIAVAFNVSLLALFKYAPTILFGNNTPDNTIWSRLILPVGISFFSFQAIGYVLDLAWSKENKQSSFKDFALYMAFFPQLLSGPIARGRYFLPQISIPKEFEYDNIVSGARLILFGAFKKIVIANNLAPYTDAVFNNVSMHEGITFVVAGVFYAIQIYMDFSGYTDIAIGSARIFGFNLIENFKAPYLAGSIVEFWRRWHISLSSWVRDYIHIPIQFKLRILGNKALIIAVFATFLIIGVWHGAKWSYVIFGVLMALLVTVELTSAELRKRLFCKVPDRIKRAFSILIVFTIMSSAMILLRGNSLSDIVHIYSNLGMHQSSLYVGSWPSIFSALLGLLVIVLPEINLNRFSFSEYIAKFDIVRRWSYYAMLIVLIVLTGEFSDNAFIYYQF